MFSVLESRVTHHVYLVQRPYELAGTAGVTGTDRSGETFVGEALLDRLQKDQIGVFVHARTLPVYVDSVNSVVYPVLSQIGIESVKKGRYFGGIETKFGHRIGTESPAASNREVNLASALYFPQGRQKVLRVARYGIEHTLRIRAQTVEVNPVNMGYESPIRHIVYLIGRKIPGNKYFVVVRNCRVAPFVELFIHVLKPHFSVPIACPVLYNAVGNNLAADHESNFPRSLFRGCIFLYREE